MTIRLTVEQLDKLVPWDAAAILGAVRACTGPMRERAAWGGIECLLGGDVWHTVGPSGFARLCHAPGTVVSDGVRVRPAAVWPWPPPWRSTCGTREEPSLASDAA